jgi:S-formylglutathione hydrolase FrmB
MPERDPAEEGGGSQALSKRVLSRRKLLGSALGGLVVVAGGVVGIELVNDGVLPGKVDLEALDGACSVSFPSWRFQKRLGPLVAGSFYSKARNRRVGYWIGYPPGHKPGDELPLIVALHAWGGNHRYSLSGLNPAEALALEPDGKPLSPMALVTVDGGRGYWNAHPGDDPMAMVIDELIPMCQRRGLGRSPFRIGTMGISMGGYGAILFAERFPRLFAACAAISPAIWTSYGQARSANPTAYASAADFAACDVLTHAGALVGKPIRVASGVDDPFYPNVRQFARRLGSGAVTDFGKGCHSGPFFHEQEPPSLLFLSDHLRA